MDYLELYKSAYTTKRLWYRYKEGVYLFRVLYICLHRQKTWESPTNNGGYKQELDRSTYTTK